jgi:hydroxypyruvate isomerase
MAFELSANLEYMFGDAGPNIEDRIAAAAAAGFRKAEIFSTANRDLTSIAAALNTHGVEIIGTVNDPRTRLVDKETHAGFRDQFRRSVEAGLAIGCRRIVVASGPAVPYMKRPVQLAIVAEAVASVAPIAEELGVTIMLEPVNTRVDHPGVLFSQTCDAMAVIDQVKSPRVRLLYDIYHSVTEGEDPAAILPTVAHVLEHVQVADAPGRGEPGSGRIDWPTMLTLLRGVGYRGAIGIECSPTRTPTASALTWFQELCTKDS